MLPGGFAICGATTNDGLIATHFVPAAHDHGTATTTAAGLLALVGVSDVIGTIASAWLTDRVDSRVLLAWYYALRGLSLFALPLLFSAVLSLSVRAGSVDRVGPPRPSLGNRSRRPSDGSRADVSGGGLPRRRTDAAHHLAPPPPRTDNQPLDASEPRDV